MLTEFHSPLAVSVAIHEVQLSCRLSKLYQLFKYCRTRESDVE